MRPELDNHWALRDFAARLMAQICKNFNTTTNTVQTRVTRLFCRALQDNKTPLASLYGAVEGLSELGSEVVKVKKWFKDLKIAKCFIYICLLFNITVIGFCYSKNYWNIRKNWSLFPA